MKDKIIKLIEETDDEALLLFIYELLIKRKK